MGSASPRDTGYLISRDSNHVIEVIGRVEFSEGELCHKLQGSWDRGEDAVGTDRGESQEPCRGSLRTILPGGIRRGAAMIW
jgi:hypothetical protein